MSATTEDENGRDAQRFVQGLARGLAVLRSFDADHRRMKLTEIAARADISRATTRRSLLTLETLGYVRCSDGLYELTPQVLEFGFAYLSGQSLAQTSRPFLEALTERTGESSSLTVLSGTDVLYVERVHTPGILRVDITVGTRFPAAVTAMGRVLIAGLPPAEGEALLRSHPVERLTPVTETDPDELVRLVDQVRQQGWAYVDQEFELGLRSLAVPIRDAAGETVAAINLTLRAVADDPFPPDRMETLLAALQETAAAIGRSAGHDLLQ